MQAHVGDARARPNPLPDLREIDAMVAWSVPTLWVTGKHVLRVRVRGPRVEQRDGWRIQEDVFRTCFAVTESQPPTRQVHVAPLQPENLGDARPCEKDQLDGSDR